MIHKLLDISIKHSLFIIIGTTIITLIFLFFAVRLKVDPDIESLIPDNKETERLVRERGGEELQGEYLIIAVESDDPFQLAKLSALYDMIERIESIGAVKQSINPFNMLAFRENEKRVEVVTLAEGRRAPETAEELSLFKKRILESPVARNLVISADATVLLAIFPVDRNLDYSVFMRNVREIVSDLKPYFNTYLSGTIPFRERTGVYLSRDFSRLIGFAAVIILLFYFLGFRSIRAVVLPFLVVATGTIWCLGFMAIFDLSLSIINIVIPPLVLTLGSSYSIHILNQYYREAGKNHPNGLWIAGAVTHVNRTIIMAAVTTIAGFLSLLAATMEQTRVFAVTTSFGILSCALLSLFFFPAVLSHLPHPSSNQSRQVVQGLLTRLIKKLGDFVVRWRIPVLLVWAVIIILFGLSAKRLEYSTDAVSYFPQKDKVMKDMYFLTEKIGGFDEISVTIVAPQNEKNYFLQQPVLEKLSLLEEDLLSNPDISYVSSFIGYLKYINETVTGVSEIPQSKGLILLFSRFLKAFSSRENISRYLTLLANEEFSRITLSLRVFNSETGKYIDEARFRAILERLEVSIAGILPPEIEWTIWGNGLRYVYLSDMIKKDHLLFMFISLSAILLIATIAFRSLRFGLYTLIPLVTGIIFNFIAMIILAVPLDMITVMVSSVAIGVGADDSIHFLLQFRRQLKKYPDNIAGAVSESLGITGRPILLTTLSIVGGLAVFAFASFKPIMYFGILVIVALTAACAGTLCILPAALTLTWKTREKNEN